MVANSDIHTWLNELTVDKDAHSSRDFRYLAEASTSESPGMSCGNQRTEVTYVTELVTRFPALSTAVTVKMWLPSHRYGTTPPCAID